MQGLAAHIPPSSCSYSQEPNPHRDLELPSPEMSPAASSISGDHIGEESCIDMVKTGEEGAAEVSASAGYCYFSERVQQRREERREMRRKEYPPPMPLLARTENLPSHMPWVLKRYYTGDGRLILREEKVRHHEYLRAHRADGRLTLHLVPMDDNVMIIADDQGNCMEGEEEDERCGNDDDGEDEAEQSADCEHVDGRIDNVEEEERESNREVKVEIGGGGGAGKCLGFTNGSGGKGVGSSYIFGVSILSPIRPVHS